MTLHNYNPEDLMEYRRELGRRLLSRRVMVRAPQHCAHLGPCWIYVLGDKMDRAYITISQQGLGIRKRSRPVYRVAGWLWCGFPLEGDDKQICHHCDNGRCFSPSHIYRGTAQDNMNDKMERGNCNPCYGERQGRARYTNEDIRALKRDHENGTSPKKIAHRYNMTTHYVHRILRGDIWKTINPEE